MSVTFSVCHETEQYLWQGADLRAFYYLVEMCENEMEERVDELRGQRRTADEL